MVNVFIFSLLDTYFTFSYTLQRYIFELILVPNDLLELVVPLLMYIMGLITIITPCFVSILPLALSYVNSKSSYSFNKNVFILGLLTSFIILMLPYNFLNFTLVNTRVTFLSYFILFLFSLDSMKILNFSKFYSAFSSGILISKKQNFIYRNYLMGIIIGFTSLPCNTSTLFIVRLLLSNFTNSSQIFYYLAIYLFGILTSLLILLKINIYSGNFYLFSRLWNFIFPASGSFLFIISLFSLLRILFT